MDENVLTVDSLDGRPVKIIYECQSGVIAHITPLNIATLRAIQLKATDLFPYPDKAPYQKPEENAFVEGTLTPAEDNPEYVAKVREIDSQRAQWADKAIFNYAAKFPKYPTKQALVDAYREQLNELRQIANLPEDDYEAVMLHLVLTWNQLATDSNKNIVDVGSDFKRIIQLAIQTVALTPAEVQAGIRFFRPYLQQSTR